MVGEGKFQVAASPGSNVDPSAPGSADWCHVKFHRFHP